MFKKRSFQSPSWCEGVKRKQNEWAHKVADCLGRQAAKVSVRRFRLYVVLLMVVWLATDYAITWKKMREPGSDKVPDVLGWPAKLTFPMPNTNMNRQEFDTFLGKLRHDPVKGKVLDSFLTARPGLADTIRMLESMSR